MTSQPSVTNRGITVTKNSSKELHELLDKGIKREMHQAELNKREAEFPKKLYKAFRVLEIGLAAYVGYLIFFDNTLPVTIVAMSLVTVLLAPSKFFYSVWLENINNANLCLNNAETLKTKKEVLSELDDIKRQL